MAPRIKIEFGARSTGQPAEVSGGLVLVPEGKTLEALAADYAKMVEDRLFLREPEPFSWIIERCREIEKRANAISK